MRPLIPATPRTSDRSPIDVEKQSFNTGLFLLGKLTGFYSPPLSNPQADLTTWYGAINAGEPYANPQDVAIEDQIARYHSAYYLLDGAFGTAREAPAPLLVANGFTDDLFPVDEAVRYYNLEQSLYPSNPIGLFDFDGGHMRGQNKTADATFLATRIQAFFDHYVKGAGPQPQLGATALTQTCPPSAPSGGPYSAPTWAALHPGEVDFASGAAHTILSAVGDPTISKAIDPIAGAGACATVSSSDQGAGVATYRLPAATGAGYTLLGAATVIAALNVTGQFALVAARLWDVDPSTPGAPGTPPVVAAPLPAVTPQNVCVMYPLSSILRSRTHASRRGMTVAGSAAESRCPRVSAALRRSARVARVYVIVYRTAPRGRCRFLQASGKLTAKRSCARVIAFLARGTTHWSLRLRTHIAPGRYLVHADAVDGLGHHQLAFTVPAVVLTVR